MEEASLQTIRQQAYEFVDDGKAWHFHIMSPTCLYNKDQRYAFVLECADDKVCLVHYSARIENELGRDLSPLLHGKNIFKREDGDEHHSLSVNVRRMLRRAKELREKRIEWHHHMLFPGCKFNKHTPKYALVFEDPETQSVIESVTDEEPTNDLKFIENLFYKQ